MRPHPSPLPPHPDATCLQAWAALKPEEQAPFLEHAAGDERRYAEECRAYEDMQVGVGVCGWGARRLGQEAGAAGQEAG